MTERCWKKDAGSKPSSGTQFREPYELICDNGVFHAYPELTYIFSYPVCTSTVEIGPAVAGRENAGQWLGDKKCN